MKPSTQAALHSAVAPLIAAALFASSAAWCRHLAGVLPELPPEGPALPGSLATALPEPDRPPGGAPVDSRAPAWTGPDRDSLHAGAFDLFSPPAIYRDPKTRLLRIGREPDLDQPAMDLPGIHLIHVREFGRTPRPMGVVGGEQDPLVALAFGPGEETALVTRGNPIGDSGWILTDVVVPVSGTGGGGIAGSGGWGDWIFILRREQDGCVVRLGGSGSGLITPSVARLSWSEQGEQVIRDVAEGESFVAIGKGYRLDAVRADRGEAWLSWMDEAGQEISARLLADVLVSGGEPAYGTSAGMEQANAAPQ